MVTQFTIVAIQRNLDEEVRRYFLIDSVDHEIARCLFEVDHPGWKIKASSEAKCFAGGEHSGALSVWAGKGGKTAVLCQHHGENPPMSNKS